MDDLITGTVELLLAREAGPKVVREMPDGRGGAQLWQALHEAGIPDAMVPEADGGSGLTLAEVYPALFALGRHAVSIPLGETILARAVLGNSAPPGRIAIAGSTRSDAGTIVCHNVSNGRHADWVVAETPGSPMLLQVAAAWNVSAAPGGSGSDTDMSWAAPANGQTLPGALPWRAAGALVTAIRMAGAIDRILEMVVEHAKSRTQFGRPIGKFQAVQQQVSVLAEQAGAARAASELACVSGSASGPVDPVRAALAKVRVGEAAIHASAIGHAVHGAIGVTEEHALQLYTSLLQHGRMSFGSGRYWAEFLGAELMEGSGMDVLEFVRARLS